MKNSILAILATFFSFFFSSAALAEWVPLGPGMGDEWGCVKYTSMNARTGEILSERKCAQNFDDFYARMSAAQKKKAIEEGLKIIGDHFPAKYPDIWQEVAMNEWFLAHTGANPS